MSTVHQQGAVHSSALHCCLSLLQRLQGDEDHVLLMRRGLLLHRLQLSHSGVFTCTSHEHAFSRALARYRLHVIAGGALLPGHHLHNQVQKQVHGPPALPAHRTSWLKHGGGNVNECCEQLWHREKRRQQKLCSLKLKEEIRKARVRRNNPAEVPD